MNKQNPTGNLKKKKKIKEVCYRIQTYDLTVCQSRSLYKTNVKISRHDSFESVRLRQVNHHELEGFKRRKDKVNVMRGKERVRNEWAP